MALHPNHTPPFTVRANRELIDRLDALADRVGATRTAVVLCGLEAVLAENPVTDLELARWRRAKAGGVTKAAGLRKPRGTIVRI